MKSMYRLLIVDDEYHVVDWLAELFEGLSDPELEIFKAYLAKDALDILSRVKIDIVLSDIKMPGMDGFDLADRIKEEWPQAKIIFLTGHNEFDYAYRANRYENVSFLLKTEDDDVITEAVLKAAKLLEEERRRLELMQSYADLRKIMEWQVYKNILLEWMEKGEMTYSPGRLEKEGFSFPFRFQKGNAVMCIRTGGLHTSPLERESFCASLQELLQKLLFEKGDIGILDMEAGCFLAVIQPRADQPMTVYLREMLDEFSAAVLDSMDCHAFFALYEEPVAFESVREKYEVLRIAAAEVADAGNLYGGRILGRREEQELKAANEPLLKDKFLKARMESLSVFLEQGKKKEFFELFDDIYSAVTKVTGRHYYPAVEIYLHFAAMYLSRINVRNLVEKLAFKTSLGRLMNVFDFADWREAFEYLRELGLLLFAEQEEEQSGRNDAFLDSVRRFVKENLHEDLSLTRIAHSLHYNPSYISRLFKQLSGGNLSDYILEERLSYARRRLSESEDTVAAIAAGAGFESSQYFSVVFKKQTGMSPGEYRRRQTSEQ